MKPLRPPEFSYVELTQIRDLCKAERHRRWIDKLLPNMSKQSSATEILTAYRIIVEEDKNPFSVIGRCNLILEKIQEFENEIHELLNQNVTEKTT